MVPHLPPHPFAVPSQYDPLATGLTDTLAEDLRIASSENKTAFIEQIKKIVRSELETHFYFSLDPIGIHNFWSQDHMRDE